MKDQIPAGGDCIAVSARVRLARNIAGWPFPQRMKGEERRRVNDLVKGALLKPESVLARSCVYYALEDQTPAFLRGLCAKHLISPAFAAEPQNRALILSKDEAISIMLGEEDHIRIQVILPGFQLEEALSLAQKIEVYLQEDLTFCFDDRLGNLTACPTNLGTGLRASLMLHLPMLEEKGLMGSLSENLSKIGLTVRGTYGEGSRPIGGFYQISNQSTLGISEKQAVDNIQTICRQILEREQAERAAEKENPILLDRIGRALGILKGAWMLSTEEALALLTAALIGQSLGFFEALPPERFFKLNERIQESLLFEKDGQTLGVSERDMVRARLLRETFLPVSWPTDG